MAAIQHETLRPLQWYRFTSNSNHITYSSRYICFASATVSVRCASSEHRTCTHASLFIIYFPSTMQICNCVCLCILRLSKSTQSKSFYFAIGQIYYIFRPLAVAQLRIYFSPSQSSRRIRCCCVANYMHATACLYQH